MVNRNDKEWIASLQNHRAGRFLAGHLASMELCDQQEGRDCAITEAVDNERVFVYAIARAVYQSREYPFGFSTALPRFIAVLNLSGERMLVHSENPALLRCLCSRSSVLMPTDLSKALRVFEEWGSIPSASGGAQFVVLTYSLPWQSGTNSTFWHLSACAIDHRTEDSKEMDLSDRVLQFSSASPKAFRGKSVLCPKSAKLTCFVPGSGALELVSDKQITDFTESYSATCLDFARAPEVGTEGGKEVQLLSMLQELQRLRKEDQEKIRRLDILLKASDAMLNELNEQVLDRVDILTRQHREEQEALKRTSDERLSVAQQQHNELLAQMGAVERSQKESATKQKRQAKDHEKLVAKHDELERKCAAKDALNNAALSNHVATISQLEGRLAKSHEQLQTIKAERDREHAAQMQKGKAKHEEALSKATLALESKKRIINQLSENNERRDVEVASLKTHEEEQERRIRDLEAEAQECAKRVSAQQQQQQQQQTTTTTTTTTTQNRSSGPPKNASTATHQCATTQTDAPEPEAPAAAPAPEGRGGKGKAGVVVAQPLPLLPSYQTALDVLQELVNASGQGGASRAPPHPLNGYPRPLPFPHFTPNMPCHTYPHPNFYAQQPQPQPQLQPQPQQRSVAAYASANFQSASY